MMVSLANCNGFPGTTPPSPCKKANTRMLLIHWHLELEAPTKEKSCSHEKKLGRPPLSVGESNVMLTYVPSLANSAEMSVGGEGGTPFWRIVKKAPLTNDTSYCEADVPDKEALIMYVPTGKDK